MRVVTVDRDPRLRRHFERLHAGGWPPFLRDRSVDPLWPRLHDEFAAYQLALVEADGRVAAVGNSVPIPWDGRDPGLRVHEALGARALRVGPRGNSARESVAWWEARTGLVFPASGRHVVPGAFTPIRVDRARDRVHYHEANVWMLHRPPGAPRGTRRRGRRHARRSDR